MDSKLFDTEFPRRPRSREQVRSLGHVGGHGLRRWLLFSSLIDMISELAKGEVALIDLCHAFVSPEGQAGRWQLAVHDDRFIGRLSQMTKVAHDGGSKIVLQLAHAGAQAETSLTNLEAVGPSSLSRESGLVGRTITWTKSSRRLRRLCGSQGAGSAF